MAVVSIGGGLGSVARYALSRLITDPRDGFPVATLVTNLLGCFLLGLLVPSQSRRCGGPSPLLRPALGTGVLGGFTTFSTFAFETPRPCP